MFLHHASYEIPVMTLNLGELWWKSCDGKRSELSLTRTAKEAALVVILESLGGGW